MEQRRSYRFQQPPLLSYDIPKRLASNKITHNQSQPSINLKNKQKSMSLFLTQFDKLEKTKALWRDMKSPKVENKDKIGKVNSWADLNKLKIKYRMQRLKRKSSEDILKQNIQMIEKVQQAPPLVDNWNYYRPKRSPRSSSEDLLMKNMQLIKKIEEIGPKVENWNFYKRKRSDRAFERVKEKEKIFQQNIKMIERFQAIPPKVDPWNYKRKLKLKNEAITERTIWKQKILQQNLKIIQRVESVPPKIDTWINSKKLKLLVQRKRSEEHQRSLEMFNKMQKIIEFAEKNLSQKDLSMNEKLKTMPNISTPPKLQKQRLSNKIKVERLEKKIERAKCQVDCWSKELRNKLNKKTENNRSLIFKRNQYVKNMTKNIQKTKQLLIKKY